MHQKLSHDEPIADCRRGACGAGIELGERITDSACRATGEGRGIDFARLLLPDRAERRRCG
jgi:hypothetical protein